MARTKCLSVLSCNGHLVCAKICIYVSVCFNNKCTKQIGVRAAQACTLTRVHLPFSVQSLHYKITFCFQAYKRGMFGPKYQWIILGGYSDDWWTTEDTTLPCSVAQLNITLHGYLATDILPLSSSRKRTESGLVSFVEINMT